MTVCNLEKVPANCRTIAQYYNHSVVKLVLPAKEQRLGEKRRNKAQQKTSLSA